MKAKPSQTIELLAVAVAAVGAVLLLPTHGSVLLLLASAAWAATLPVLIWVYARIRVPRHLSAIVAAACGLAAFPAFYSMSFLVEGGPMPFQFVGFGAGLRVHDRVPQATFGRIVHLLLLGMGVVFDYRGLR